MTRSESEDPHGIDPTLEVLERLSSHALKRSRYVEKGLVGKGGMGAVLRVKDLDLKRDLAMKVVLSSDGEHKTRATEVERKRLERFLEEAQVTAQLAHPGIVPVHELGLDDEGAVYFTMELVRGRDLGEVFQRVQDGEEEWTRTGVLMVLLKACEAMAYAHKNGVIHRDLKPDNVMVGRYGEVYVMDWGLAHVEGTADRHDVRPDRRPTSASTVIESDRSAWKKADETASVLRTMDGDVLGTPAYMSPEQARGLTEKLGPHSDVYSMGAMVYHLLAGFPPYCSHAGKTDALQVLRQLLEGPPRPLEEVATDVPPELLAICQKAMARRSEDRYPDMSELADDLRAYLEGRVVRAYETGALATFRKWVARNRALAGAWAAALVAALVGLAAVGWVEHRGKQAERELRGLAEDNAAAARVEREKVLRLSAFRTLEGLVAEAERLWPATPERVPLYRDWLARARALVEGLREGPTPDVPGHLEVLDELRARATSGSAEAGFTFDDDEDAWWHAQLALLIEELRAFDDEETGLTRGTSARWGWGVERRLAYAERVAERSLADPAWALATASIADPDESPAYGGLVLTPQLDLVPVGRDADSGLWEFAHLATGRVPQRDSRGWLRIGEDTALVLVLIPGGTFGMGSQSTHPDGENYDEQTQEGESPVHEVPLDPFFLAKHELTQGQWLFLTGENPAKYRPGADLVAGQLLEEGFTLRHPVESVSWHRAVAVLGRFALSLPTEAQWEYAARAGAPTPWWVGEDVEYLDGAANLSDAYARRNGARWQDCEEWLDDGYLLHAPVGSFEANPFGLHDVHGNLIEWCRDLYADYRLDPAAGDGLRNDPRTTLRVSRGGAFMFGARMARSAGRQRVAPETISSEIGLRPARAIVR